MMVWLVRIAVFLVSYALAVNGLVMFHADGVVGVMIAICVAFVVTVFIDNYLAERRKRAPPAQ